MPCRHLSISIAAASLLLGPAVHAGPISAYTDFDAYVAAIAGLGPERREGFDATATPRDIAEGSSYGGFRFSGYDLAGAIPRIVDRAGQTSSSANGLETDLGSFVGGDGFSMTSALPLSAFGLFVVSADPLEDGDVLLEVGGGAVSLVAADAITGARLWTDFDFSVGANAQVFFLGAIATAPFTEIVLGSSSAAAFGFGIDDLRSVATVPAPSVAALLLPGLLLLRRGWLLTGRWRSRVST